MLDISKLMNDSEEILQINETIEFKEDDLKNTDIKRLENIKAVGTINRVNNNVFHIRLNITGTMVLTCARSLEEVPQKLDIFINQNIDDKENIEEKPLILQNTLDIFSIVWENIVLEIPISYTVSKEIEIEDNEKEKDELIDPRMAPLMGLLDKEKEWKLWN